MTPEEASIRALCYICAAVLSAYGLLVLVASLWEFKYRQAAERRILAREVTRELAAGRSRKLRQPTGAARGITTDAVPGD